MPISPTYPGVYVEEIPSGVRTITGVSTSVTAFIGNARRGPIDKAVRILGFADYERRFGGLASDSEMSYAVRQFFTNGGSEAWVVRVAKASTKAAATLSKGSNQILVVTAADAGTSGANIRLIVDYNTSNPASTFNLTVIYSSKDEPGGGTIEKFANLSMNSKDPRYVLKVVNGQSNLVTVALAPTIPAVGSKGSSVGDVLPAAIVIDSTHNQIRISVDGSDFATIQLPATVNTGTKAATAINNALALIPGFPPAAASFPASKQLTIISGTAGEQSSVHILPGLSNDASGVLKLGTINGGVEKDAAADIRPDAVPLAGSLTGGGTLTAGALLLITGPQRLQISLDGGTPLLVVADASGGGISDPVAFALQLQTTIQALNLASDAYRNFTVTWDATAKSFTLRSGTQGSGSSVAVFSGSPDLATALKLLDPAAVSTPGVDISLQTGSETPFDPLDDTNTFPVIIGSRSNRTGIYALDDVDLFNLLSMPAVSYGPTLAEAAAYCQERRAFLIADPPPNLKPDAMETLVKSPSVPKTNYGAIYYPWIKIADATGALRSSAPSGTIAGVYARTDAERGVWKAPAGTDASLVGVQGVDYPLTDRENGILNPRGVNCNRNFPTYGPVSWGARTLQGDNDLASEWKYVPIRRLALFIEESLFRGTQWVVFEPNDEPLWSQIRLNVGAFMQNLFRQGAFQGRAPREAYLVKCDKETTTQNDINLGIVNILVGFAPLKPAEFVFLQIQQLAGQIQT